MFGNSMFGHHTIMAAHNTSNTGFGGGGFGHAQSHSAFESSKKGSSSSFASGSAHLDPHGVLHQGYDSHGHYHHGILRQNSLLGEMTQSKKERQQGAKPWAFASISYPTGEHGDGSVLGMGSAYHKPLEETHTKPKLHRQHSFSVGEGLEHHKRAPSFSSDPERMRSKTISTASMPTKPLFKRSLSIAEDITEPQNMDIARPFMRRQQSLNIEKARRKSMPANRNTLIRSLSKFRRSSKAKTDNFTSDSEASSLHIPSYRSRTNSAESRRSSRHSIKYVKSDKEKDDQSPKQRKSSPNEEDSEHAKLILGLMNPIRDEEVFETHDPPAPPSPLNPPELEEKRLSTGSEASTLPIRSHSPIESPTLVYKRIHQLSTPEPEAVPVKSNISDNRSSPSATNGPVSVRSQIRNYSAPIPHVTISVAMKQHHVDVTDGNPVESDTSEIYYDCDSIEPPKSPLNALPAPSPIMRNKKRCNKRSRDRGSSSTCTDGEDTTSTCDTPPRATFRDIRAKFEPEYLNQLEVERHQRGVNDQNDVETLQIRRGKEQPNYKNIRSNNLYSQPLNVNEGRRKSSNPELMVPVYSALHKDNQNNESGTADSSESGYATSNIPPVSPKNYDHVKVSQFVNSLPYYPDIVEHGSEHNHHGDILLNGSGTDNDSVLEQKVPPYPGSDMDIGSINCASGSDTENESVKSDISSSKLEVMKILDRSPTDVRQRITNTLNERKNKQPITNEEEELSIITTPTTTTAKLRSGSNASETEVMKLLKHEEKKKDSFDEEVDDVKHVEIKTVVINRENEANGGAETQLVNGNVHPSFAASVIERFSFARQYSAYQSRSTKCVDLLLHILNVILFLSSAGVVTLGVWLQLKDFNVNDITVILGNNLLQIIVYIGISGAGVTMLAAFCLCCGIRQDKVGLGFYASVLVAVVIAFATAAVLSTIFSDKLRGVEFRFNFKDRLMHKYGLEAIDIENKFFTDAWDDMQVEFECCGGEGNENDTESWALYRMSEWFRNHENRGMVFVPESCCRKDSNIKTCQGGDHHLLGPPRYAPPRNKYYPDPNPNLNSNGCYTYFSKYLSKMSMYIALGCGSLAGLYFLTVMLTWVFCFKKSQDWDESFYDESYYDIEDDVFNSEDGNVLVNRDADMHHKIEETKFSNTNTPDMKSNRSVITPACNGNLKHRNDVSMNNRGQQHAHYDDIHDNHSDITNYTANSTNYTASARNVYISHNNSDSSDSDSDSESSNSAHSEVIERRNIWLSSGCTAGHLLSVAIEEEDSNFEDSDIEDINHSAHV